MRLSNLCALPPKLNNFAQAMLLAVCLGSSALAWGAGLNIELVNSAGEPVVNGVVTLRGPIGNESALETAVMDQQDKQFVPNVLVVRTGTQVKFPNSDNIRHHVYSFSPAKRFELRLYQGTPSEPVTFDKPGVVVLGCNIHDWMIGYVYVTDDPRYAVTNQQGQAQIDQLPKGRYAVTLWHPQTPNMLPQKAADIALDDGQLSQRFTLSMLEPTPSQPMAQPQSSFGDAFNKAKKDAAQ